MCCRVCVATVQHCCTWGNGKFPLQNIAKVTLLWVDPQSPSDGPGKIKCCAVGMLIYRLSSRLSRAHEHVSPHPAVVVVVTAVVVACPPFGIWHFLIAQMHPRSTKQATQTNNRILVGVAHGGREREMERERGKPGEDCKD